ncbi:uncharacterized protein F5891DRAFT_1183600 [Suillus fuscotomentosus]|uniref:Uncharacterized protein n=1 Tax=Suillus fuscotomentosus TaxID=1912939 RepID=A0AAD4EF06_9AGAM|nr:uncharacterized protein F5891DRAFT_1183600 [Suillus fuscotomentosus]KAG1904956.1 hypothetical protein F5891DRAFT_1183600 [Suillus fuscotomentosus]
MRASRVPLPRSLPPLYFEELLSVVVPWVESLSRIPIPHLHRYTNKLATTEYNLENEFAAGYENTDDPIAKRDQAYELCFNGHCDEIRSMLSDMYLLESMRTSDITVHMVSPPGFTADITGRNDRDPQDLAWDNPSSEGSPKDPYASQWGHPSHDVGIAGSSESMADAYDCGWDDPMHDESITLPGKSRDNLYDCGWDDPMDHQLIMESGESPADAYDCGWDDPKDHHIISTDDSAEDQYDCGWGDPMDTDKPSTAVMAEQHCGDVNPSVAEDLYDCGWDAVGMPGRHAGNEHNVFQHAEHSMRHAIRSLRSIWHEDANSYLNNILPTDEVDRDQMPAATQTANRNVLGTYADAVIKVTELSEDVATIHHFLNVQRRIMDQLDNMIAICERDGRAT